MADSHESLGSIKRALQRAWYIPVFESLTSNPIISRSHLQPALKSKGFDDRMEKASKAQAIKKLQAELKEEKEAELRR